MRLAAIAVVLLLAGCIGPTPTTRSDQLHIDVLAYGEWRLELPLPDDDWIRERWQDELRVSQGNATLRFQDTALALVITGNGSANIEAFGRWEDPDCCLLAFNQGTWSNGDADDGALAVFAEGDIRSISVAYAALGCRGDGCRDTGPEVDTCTLELHLVTTSIEPGFDAFPRQPVSRTCIP